MADSKTRPRPAPDFDRLRERLALQSAELERSRSDESAILKRRAAEIAEDSERRESGGVTLDVLEFKLDLETYAVESPFVIGAMQLREYAVLPFAPSVLVGVALFRGRVLSIFDLHQVFDLPRAGLSELNRVIVLSAGTLEIGILADSLVGVGTIQPEHMSPALPSGLGRDSYCIGISRTGTILLDVRRLLAAGSPLLQLSASASVAR